MRENNSLLWGDKLKFPTGESNKYSQGWVVILGGAKGKTGAAKLSSLASMRAGAGLATICHFPETSIIYESWALSVMTHEIRDVNEFDKFLQDNRISSILIGPGCGVNSKTKEMTLCALSQRKPCVLDADAITVFQSNSNELFKSLHSNVVLTPHFGEFQRIFQGIGSRIEMAEKAAKETKCTVLLKGCDTIISNVHNGTVVNKNAPSCLATAGSGDVLAGIIAGLMATGIEPFHATCAGVWIHSEAGKICGAGIISDDLVLLIKEVMKGLRDNTKS